MAAASLAQPVDGLIRVGDGVLRVLDPRRKADHPAARSMVAAILFAPSRVESAHRDPAQRGPLSALWRRIAATLSKTRAEVLWSGENEGAKEPSYGTCRGLPRRMAGLHIDPHSSSMPSSL